MIENTAWEEFLAFERKQRLFDYIDNKGISPWSLVRMYVYNCIVYDIKESKNRNISNLEGGLKRKLKSIGVLFKSLIGRREKYFFFLASRSIINGVLMDQNSISALNSLNPKDCFLMESYADIHDERLNYYKIPCPLLTHLLYRFIKRKYDFTRILSVVKNKYPNAKVSLELCNQNYKMFYSQFYFYTFLFRLKGFKKIFVTQNCLQQGMYYAAHKLGIPVYEFQHGIATKAHMAYSFPMGYENLGDKIYVADTIFSLSSFWLQDCYNPISKIIPIGNDYFAPPFDRSNVEPFSILVVSANVFGNNLSSLIIDYLNKGKFLGTVYFKLHPNQFDEYKYYSNLFQKFPMVRVITNEISMQELLDRVDSMLVIQSTAVYEALYRGVKVFILKKQSYRVHTHIFNENGVYLVENANDLYNLLEVSKMVKVLPNESFFTPFDKMNFLNAIGKS